MEFSEITPGVPIPASARTSAPSQRPTQATRAGAARQRPVQAPHASTLRKCPASTHRQHFFAVSCTSVSRLGFQEGHKILGILELELMSFFHFCASQSTLFSGKYQNRGLFKSYILRAKKDSKRNCVYTFFCTNRAKSFILTVNVCTKFPLSFGLLNSSLKYHFCRNFWKIFRTYFAYFFAHMKKSWKLRENQVKNRISVIRWWIYCVCIQNGSKTDQIWGISRKKFSKNFNMCKKYVWKKKTRFKRFFARRFLSVFTYIAYQKSTRSISQSEFFLGALIMAEMGDFFLKLNERSFFCKIFECRYLTAT